VEIIKYFLIYVAVVVLWLNILASIAIKYDNTLESVQKIGQHIFVWIIPLIGAGFVLKLVYDHQPETIPRCWIPFGFKNLIYGKPPKRNKHRGAESEYDSAYDGPHSSDGGGGSDGGGD